jgi:RNA polymerase sigma factor (sigma-70 family)
MPIREPLQSCALKVESADTRLERLINGYGGVIRSVVARMLSGRAEAARDDVEQEVRVALWKRLKTEAPIEHPAAYVYQAARREAIRILRREAIRFAQEREADWEALPASRTDDPASALESHELRERLDEALRRVGPERRRALEAHLMGFEVQEIMRMYGWSYNKARNLVARGVADVREILGEREKG